ncbi:MAG TPA: tRNA (adenosine(37)-N6)-threonylcarbamoyltransferase complex transferase subunit TsaD [Candidatus Acidoferrales bacterium]|nr:tRNA (adenosine(37)-N6)-threonylcarbamoyltransferase complex transferase subunit TsaD [Candidatus Acidoferrales bacterium]
MRLLALETSCDETAAAVVSDDFTVESSVVASQAAAHAEFGGVVPELAARMHLERIPSVVVEAMQSLGGLAGTLDGVAVAKGPGLVGCLAVGVTYAQSLAAGLGLPVVGVNHMSGHVLAARIEDPALEPPFVALVVSGGHTDLIHYQAHDRVVLLGATRDDAVGEAFDKVARMLGLPYPGGPAIDRLAAEGDPTRYRLPRPVLPNFAFSFSGLKTAVLYLVRDLGELSHRQIADLAASFRLAAVETLCTQLEAAVEHTASTQVVLAGGVASNQLLRRLARERLQGIAEVTIPAPELCTDNAAMIGAAAWTKVSWSGFDTEPFGVEPGLRAYV